MLFSPAEAAAQTVFSRTSTLRRWAKRLGFCAVLAVGFGAALLLFAPLL